MPSTYCTNLQAVGRVLRRLLVIAELLRLVQWLTDNEHVMLMHVVPAESLQSPARVSCYFQLATSQLAADVISDPFRQV